MPMPKLFKRLSEKNLRKRATSMDVKFVDLESQAVPPLPPPKSPRYNSFSTLRPSPYDHGTLATSSMPSLHPDSAEIVTRNGRPSAATLPAPKTADQKDTMSDELVDAWNHLEIKAPKANANEAEKILEKIEGAAAQANLAGNSTMAIGVTTILNTSGGMQAIEQGVNHFLEGSEILMNVLDEVQKLHPFIGVAVMAFKTVYTLEMSRRENDKKIIALHVEMKDLMYVLVQLKEVSKKDADETAPDGTTIKSRLESLAHKTANDIKACSNACDTYSKKKLVVKVLKSTIWQQRLVEFSGVFTKRRSEFEFALAIHTARGVDSANKTLGDVDQTTREMKAKMDMMMKLFEKFMPTEEKEMAKLIEDKGGAIKCQEDDKILQELSKQNSGGSVPTVAVAGRRGAPKVPDFEDLKTELRLDPDIAIQKNMEIFSRKFEMQKRLIIQEMEAVVKREGDRVISAVTAGPHDRIIDPDVHQVWKDMGWRGNVKSRHFVMGLRDHFQDKWNVEHKKQKSKEVLSMTSQNDEWALAFLTISRLQAVSEAFDDDASGFVTVGEVNAFTSSRPRDWSLPRWLAYWAIGWQQVLSDYADKIKNLISKMFAILPKIPKGNMPEINNYLSMVYSHIVALQMAVKPYSLSDGLREKFKSYVEAEEARLEGNLETVKYDIDAPNTLALITGPGRIEQFVLPLLYLVLKRHFEIFRISRFKRTHPNELSDAVETIVYIFLAVDDRVTNLKTMFHQQKLDTKQEFQTFAHGLYSYYYEPLGQWPPDLVKDTDYVDEAYDDALEAQNLEESKILHYPGDQDELDFAAYSIPAPTKPSTSLQPSPLHAILGPWHGYMYGKEASFTPSGMISMDFSLNQITDKELHFQASGRNDDTDFTVIGKCTPGDTDDLIIVSLTRTFLGHSPTSYWHGQFDISTDTITGTCGSEPDNAEHEDKFLLKRTAPEYLRFRPLPSDFDVNRPRALWAYGCAAIKNHIRQQSMSWTFFKERRDQRRRFIELYIRYFSHGQWLNDAEKEELDRLHASFTTADSRYYYSLAKYQIRRTTQHEPYFCDHCGATIGGARLICLICQSKHIWDTIDLCDTPECVAAVIGTDIRSDIPRPHLPTHDLIKVRRVVHSRQFGTIYRAAKKALQNARAIFDQPARPIPRVARSIDTRRISRMEKPVPKCVSCEENVAQPCWYCVECEEDVFVCMSCDTTKGGVTIDGHSHKEDHALVRCQPFVPAVETSSVEDRLARVEKLLETILQKLAVDKVEQT